MAKDKPIRKQPTQKVWHIYHFGERYELPDDRRTFRRGPLLFTRGFVGSGQDDESISHHKQIEALMSQPEGLAARGLFDELLNRAANQSRCYRGYLLDEKYRSAGLQTLAQWARQESKAVKTALDMLEKVGLLERVPMPEFDPQTNEPPANPPDEAEPSEDTEAGPKGKKKKAKKKKKTSRKGVKKAENQGSPELTGNERKPLKNGNGNGKTRLPSASGNGKDPNEAEKSTAAAPLSPEAQEEKPTPKQTSTQSASQVDAESEGDGASRTTSSPTTTPPMSMPKMPTDSDAGGGNEKRHRSQNPPCSVNDVVGQLERLYDPQCKEFAAVIYEALKVPHLPDSPEGRREICNYADAWSKAQTSGIPPSGLMELWAKSVKEAETLGNKRRRAHFTKGPEAVWRSTFNKRLDKMRGPRLARECV